MLTAILVASLLSQCPGGQCVIPQATYAAPRFYFAPPAPAPQMWQLADRNGTVWQHADPAYLRAWVANRNGLQLTTPAGGR